MKLTELQRHRVQEAIRHSTEVLRDVRRIPRKGKEQDELRELENAVSNLESFNLSARTLKK